MGFGSARGMGAGSSPNDSGVGIAPPEIRSASDGLICFMYISFAMGLGGQDAAAAFGGSAGLGRAKARNEEMCVIDRIGVRFLRRTVGELIKRRRKRHAAGDTQHFLEGEFLHDVLLDAGSF